MTDVFASETVVDPLVELVGEDKKFKTVADLAKGKLEADKFINDLKAEMAELRTHLSGQADLDALKAELQELRDKSGATKPGTPEALSAADIKALVTKAITEEESSKTATQNIREANQRMITKFGTLENATTALNTRAQELGLPVKTLQGIAAQSPTAFEQMVIGKLEAPQSETFVRGTVSSQALPVGSTQAPKEGSWEYFQNIKKTKGVNAYFDPQVQNALHKAVAAGTCLLP